MGKYALTTFVTEALKEGTKSLMDRLAAPRSSSPAAPPTVADCRMTGPQSSEAKWPSWTVISDEPPAMGGGDTAPPPSSIFVASIGFAENVIFARQAAQIGFDFESLETHVEAQWDRKGLYNIEGADPSITDLLIETRIGTSAPIEKVVDAVNLTALRSPMARTMARAAKVTRKLVYNGKESPL